MFLLVACGSDPSTFPPVDELGTGGDLGAGGSAANGTGGGLGGAPMGTGGASSGGASSGGAAGAGGVAGSSAGGIAPGDSCTAPGAICAAGSTCYAYLCTAACTTDAECAAGERCAEMYTGGRLTEATRPPLGCLHPCHVPGAGNDVNGCVSAASCEPFIGSRIVGADDGSWLPSGRFCDQAARFCAATTATHQNESPICGGA